MQELQSIIEWVGIGLVGMLIFIVILMLTQLYKQGNRNDYD